MSKRSIERVLDEYAAATTGSFVERSEAVSSENLLGPFLDMFPPPPARILDVAAGTGRDAAWLSQRGYEVTAVEPVAALREVGMNLHATDRIDWCDGTLPDLVICRHRRADSTSPSYLRCGSTSTIAIVRDRCQISPI